MTLGYSLSHYELVKILSNSTLQNEMSETMSFVEYVSYRVGIMLSRT